jgi:hypothetical protein
MQFGTNHLGHFVLVSELLPVLKKTGTEELPARVVVLSSGSHFRWDTCQTLWQEPIGRSDGLRNAPLILAGRIRTCMHTFVHVSRVVHGCHITACSVQTSNRAAQHSCALQSDPSCEDPRIVLAGLHAMHGWRPPMKVMWTQYPDDGHACIMPVHVSVVMTPMHLSGLMKGCSVANRWIADTFCGVCHGKRCTSGTARVLLESKASFGSCAT